MILELAEPGRDARFVLFGTGPAQHGLDPLQQQPLAERLVDVVVGPEVEAEDLVDLVVLGGQHDHRDLGGLAQAAQHFHAVHARHLDVQDHQVGRLALDRVESRRAVVISLHHVAVAFQRQRNRSDDVLVVVDESNIGHRALWVLSRISCRYYRPASPATTRGAAKLSPSFASPAWRDCGADRRGRPRAFRAATSP
jgi:hypothetical protein